MTYSVTPDELWNVNDHMPVNQRCSLLLLTIVVVGFSLGSCARMPFGSKPIMLTVQPSTLNSSKLANWYESHRYRSGYWFKHTDVGTYFLVALGERPQQFEISHTNLRRVADGQLKLGIDVSPTTVHGEETTRAFYPSKLFMIKPGIDASQLIIREHKERLIKAMRQQNEQLKSRNDQLRQKVSNLRDTTRFMKSVIADSRTQIQRLENRQRQRRTTIEDLQTTRDQQQEALSRLQNTNQKLKDKIERLTDDLERLNNRARKKLRSMTDTRTVKSGRGPAAPLLTLGFQTGQYELSEEQQNKLLSTIQNVEMDSSATFTIIGFTDDQPARGHLRNNLYLSILRSWHVSQTILQNTNLSQKNLLLIGAGPQSAEGSNKTKRRVEIYRLGRGR